MTRNRRNKKDLLIVGLATGCFFVFSIYIDLFEILRDGFGVTEAWGLDELFPTLMFLSFWMLWYSRRRYSDFKVATEDFLESEIRYQTLYKHAPIGIGLAYQDGTFICCNDAMCKMTGYSEEELKRINLDNTYLYPENRRQLLESLNKEYETRPSSIPRKRKDGSIYFIEPIITSFPFEGQNVLLSIVEDITERKEIEEQLISNREHLNDLVRARTLELAQVNDNLLREIAERKEAGDALHKSERILRASQKAAQIGSYMLDIASGHWESSDILDAIFGIDSNYEKTVSKWLEIVHPEDREEMKEYLIDHVLAHHNAFDKQYRIVRPSDKAVRCVHGIGMLEFNKDGHPIEMIGIVQDITERKAAEDALRKSEHRYEELFTSLLEGVCVVDASETITFCNPAFSKMLEEESTEQVIGKSLLDYLAPDQKEIILAQTAIRETNVSSKYELEIITAKNNRRSWHLSSSPRFNENGEYCGTSANIFDMTEVKRLRELESRAQRLETVGQVAGQVAHDFNNLLAPLVAYPELIREELPDDHPAKKYLLAMEKSATQIAEINDQLLTLGRRGHYNLVPTDLNRIVRQVVDESKQAHGSIEYQISFAEHLSKFMGGPAQIHRVIMNLLENSCDAMKDTGVLKIMTEDYYLVENGSSTGSSIPAGEYVKLTVSDSGEGIKDALLPKIFDPFFSSKDSDKRRGSGLGLSIVHSVVKDHGGYLDLSTRVGEGTSFFLYFPVTDERAETAEIDEFNGGSESILIVDDDPLQRDVSGRLLAKLGYRYTLAASGEKAIELLSEESYDLLILDMIMPPGIDGTETYRRALAVNPGQRAIIISGFSESNRIDEAKSLGAGAFIKKPLTRQVIARAIRAELDRKLQLSTN